MSEDKDIDIDIWDKLESLPEQIEEGHKVSKWTVVRLLNSCIEDLQRIARESYEAEIILAYEQPMEYLKHSTGADETVSGHAIILKDTLLRLLKFLPDQINGKNRQKPRWWNRQTHRI